MFKTDSFLGIKKLGLNQNVWHDHATVQQDVLLHFWAILHILLSSSRAFHCLPSLFRCLSLWTSLKESYKIHQWPHLYSRSFTAKSSSLGGWGGVNLPSCIRHAYLQDKFFVTKVSFSIIFSLEP